MLDLVAFWSGAFTSSATLALVSVSSQLSCALVPAFLYIEVYYLTVRFSNCVRAKTSFTSASGVESNLFIIAQRPPVLKSSPGLRSTLFIEAL